MVWLATSPYIPISLRFRTLRLSGFRVGGEAVRWDVRLGFGTQVGKAIESPRFCIFGF